MVSACCALAIRIQYSHKADGTIANRGFFWQAKIRLRIHHRCQESINSAPCRLGSLQEDTHHKVSSLFELESVHAKWIGSI
jgi:hypothetical protein